MRNTTTPPRTLEDAPPACLRATYTLRYAEEETADLDRRRHWIRLECRPIDALHAHDSVAKWSAIGPVALLRGVPHGRRHTAAGTPRLFLSERKGDQQHETILLATALLSPRHHRIAHRVPGRALQHEAPQPEGYDHQWLGVCDRRPRSG